MLRDMSEISTERLILELFDRGEKKRSFMSGAKSTSFLFTEEAPGDRFANLYLTIGLAEYLQEAVRKEELSLVSA